jgi:hypothetical protein
VPSVRRVDTTPPRMRPPRTSNRGAEPTKQASGLQLAGDRAQVSGHGSVAGLPAAESGPGIVHASRGLPESARRVGSGRRHPACRASVRKRGPFREVESMDEILLLLNGGGALGRGSAARLAGMRRRVLRRVTGPGLSGNEAHRGPCSMFRRAEDPIADGSDSPPVRRRAESTPGREASSPACWMRRDGPASGRTLAQTERPTPGGSAFVLRSAGELR